MDNFILVQPDILNDATIDMVLAFFDKNKQMHRQTVYAVGQNTKTFIMNIDNSVDAPLTIENMAYYHEKAELVQHMRDILETFILTHCVNQYAYIKDKWNAKKLYFSSFQLRKFYGPTKMHIDNIDPFYSPQKKKIFTRVATIIITLSNTKDTLLFPFQNKEVQLEKGMIVMFPPFWNYKHCSSFDSQPFRFGFQTWIYEVHDLDQQDHVML